jgi:hypothetical protein
LEQGDELRLKTQGGVVRKAIARQIVTRPRLGRVLSACPYTILITALMRKVRARALCRPLLLFCMDDCQAYFQAIRSVVQETIHTGKVGRTRLRPWDAVLIVQSFSENETPPCSRKVVSSKESQTRRVAHGGQE